MRLLLPILACLSGCGLRPVNPGAECEIVPGMTDNGMLVVAESNHLDADGAGVAGLWTETDMGHERIYVRGLVGPAGFVLLHEYQHHLEHQLELSGDQQGLRTARHAFRQLMGGGFEIGQDDLMTEIP